MSAPSPSADAAAAHKEAAAVRAVDFVRSGMKVGLGTGSTALFATRRLAALLKSGGVKDIVAFATSRATTEEANRLGIPLMDDALPEDLDLTIDGADEVDPAMDVIKGGGGALLREKIVAQASRRVIIVVDASKPSPRLGTVWPVPVEVIAYGWMSQARYLETLGARWEIRVDRDGRPFFTDSGNWILDCRFGPIADAGHLASLLNARAGIVEHGLFIGLATDLIVAGAEGIRHLSRDG